LNGNVLLSNCKPEFQEELASKAIPSPPVEHEGDVGREAIQITKILKPEIEKSCKRPQST
jgi:hypothetical protein